MIFDSSAIMELIKEDDFQKKYQIKGNIKSTSVTLYELLRGAIYLKLKENSERELNTLLNLFSDIQVISLNEKSAKVASYLHAQLKNNGKMINDADIMIASICIHNNEKLITKDNDFRKIQEIYPSFQVDFLG